MKYSLIREFDIANGEGVRVTLFTSGCPHHCKGCFNEDTWDFNSGMVYDKEIEEHLLKSLAKPFIKGLSLLGGEPLFPSNQETLLKLLKKFKNSNPTKDVWCYTGYSFDVDFKHGGSAYTEYTDELFSLIDVLVDGKFIQERKNLKLRFRGSDNQRVIDLKHSLATNSIKLYIN